MFETGMFMVSLKYAFKKVLLKKWWLYLIITIVSVIKFEDSSLSEYLSFVEFNTSLFLGLLLHIIVVTAIERRSRYLFR